MIHFTTVRIYLIVLHAQCHNAQLSKRQGPETLQPSRKLMTAIFERITHYFNLLILYRSADVDALMWGQSQPHEPNMFYLVICRVSNFWFRQANTQTNSFDSLSHPYVTVDST